MYYPLGLIIQDKDYDDVLQLREHTSSNTHRAFTGLKAGEDTM